MYYFLFTTNGGKFEYSSYFVLIVLLNLIEKNIRKFLKRNHHFPKPINKQNIPFRTGKIQNHGILKLNISNIPVIKSINPIISKKNPEAKLPTIEEIPFNNIMIPR